MGEDESDVVNLTLKGVLLRSAPTESVKMARN
jgi:hypothetical protein